jgi:hypothetical protein
VAQLLLVVDSLVDGEAEEGVETPVDISVAGEDVEGDVTGVAGDSVERVELNADAFVVSCVEEAVVLMISWDISTLTMS